MLGNFFVKVGPKLLAHPEALGLFAIAGAAIAVYSLLDSSSKEEKGKSN